jgi:ABC-type transporter Mla subunit MlaD
VREVREWLDLYEVDPDQAAQLTRLNDKVRKRIETLEQQRDDLDATLDELREILAQVERRLAGRPSGPQ